MKNILNVVNIEKSFGNKKVIDKVSFKIKKGEILGFIGPNGAGKTTCIKLILGLQKIDAGNIYINDYNVKKDFEKAIINVGAIVESPDLYMYLSGRENLKLISNMYDNIKEEYIEELIKFVKLDKEIDDKVSKYSLGMRQRLGIAAALINNPNLLVLDEPTNGLDPEGIKDLREILKKLAQNKKIGVLVSSHNLNELESFCTDVCLINNGHIVGKYNLNKIKEEDIPKYTIILDNTKGIKKYLDSKDEVLEKSIIIYRKEEEIPKLIEELVHNKYKIYEVRKDIITLEDAYLKEMAGSLHD